jgi:hypothetical protein
MLAPPVPPVAAVARPPIPDDPLLTLPALPALPGAAGGGVDAIPALGALTDSVSMFAVLPLPHANPSAPNVSPRPTRLVRLIGFIASFPADRHRTFARHESDNA